MSAPGKIVGVGGNFLMLHFNKPKITRAFRIPMPGPRLFIAPRMSDATLSHYFARLESEMMLFMYAKMLHETGKSSRYPVFSAGGAQVQRVKSTQVKDSLPDWMPVIDDKPAFALAHQAHCQLLVDAQSFRQFGSEFAAAVDGVPLGQSRQRAGHIRRAVFRQQHECSKAGAIQRHAESGDHGERCG